LATFFAKGQTPITLYNQFQGPYDATMVGNSMNQISNQFFEVPEIDPNTGVTVVPDSDDCADLIGTSSSSTLALGGSSVVAAYLYWSGSSSQSGEGDFMVDLNGTTIFPTQTWEYQRGGAGTSNRWFFGARADVTAQVAATGNGVYTLSNLDVAPFVRNAFALAQAAGTQDHHCWNNTFYAGWSIVIVTSNPNNGQNQVNIYDGFDAMPQTVGVYDEVNVTLNNLELTSTAGAKVEFLAWEGDSDLNVRENALVNGSVLSNGTNPSGQNFNETNSFDGTNTYNMDMDFYDISNSISTGANQSVDLTFSTGRDFVIFNNLVSVVNNESPDATINIDEITCNGGNIRDVNLTFTVSNIDPPSTDTIPAGTPVAIYIGSRDPANVVGTTTIPSDILEESLYEPMFSQKKLHGKSLPHLEL